MPSVNMGGGSSLAMFGFEDPDSKVRWGDTASWGGMVTDHSHSQLVSPFVCVPGSAPLLAQQGEVHKQISGGWNTMARSNAKKVLTQPT